MYRNTMFILVAPTNYRPKLPPFPGNGQFVPKPSKIFHCVVWNLQFLQSNFVNHKSYRADRPLIMCCRSSMFTLVTLKTIDVNGKKFLQSCKSPLWPKNSKIVQFGNDKSYRCETPLKIYTNRMLILATLRNYTSKWLNFL